MDALSVRPRNHPDGSRRRRSGWSRDAGARGNHLIVKALSPTTRNLALTGRDERHGDNSSLRLRYAGAISKHDSAIVSDRNVVTVELEEDGILVIHAMLLRAKYRAFYEEAMRWRI